MTQVTSRTLAVRTAIQFALACQLLTFAAYSFTIALPFKNDDFGFARLSRLNLLETLALWSPRGWFYRPVFLLYFRTLLAVFGFNAPAFHIVSILLHGAVVALLGLLAWRLTTRLWAGVIASGLFLLSPTPHESISWASSASTLLAAAFGLVAAHAWLTWREVGGRRWYVAALTTFWLAMCSKEEGLTVFALLVALEVLHGNGWKKSARALVPVAVLAVCYLGLEVVSILQFRLEPVWFVDFGTSTYERSGSYPLPVKVKMLLPHFDLATWGVFNLVPRGWISLVSFVVSVATLGPQWRNRNLQMGLAWLIPACAMFPMLLGRDCMGSRFTYFTVLSGAFFMALLANTLIDKGSAGRTIAALIAGAVMANYAPVFTDPITEAWIGFGVLCVSAVLWRVRHLPTASAASLVLLVMGTQLPVLAGLNMPDWWSLVLILLCGTAHGKQWPLGALTAIVVITTPASALCIVLAALVSTQRLKARKVVSETSNEIEFSRFSVARTTATQTS